MAGVQQQSAERLFIYVVKVRASPLYGFVQLIDDGLKHRFVGGEIWPMETSSEERQSSTLRITARLVKTLTGYHTPQCKFNQLPYDMIFVTVLNFDFDHTTYSENSKHEFQTNKLYSISIKTHMQGHCDMRAHTKFFFSDAHMHMHYFPFIMCVITK